jgi:hypothetical protein
VSHPAESTHWYTRAGEPAYTVKDAKGNDRPTTLRDARKLGLYPSVTSIIRLAAAPGLEIWKRNQVLMSAMTLPRLPDQSESDWMDAVAMDAQEQGKKAAERGTAIHKELESRDSAGEYAKHVINAAKAREDWVGVSLWEAERSFSHPLGFGGKCDDSCAAAIVDYKTTEKDLKTIKTWPEHAWQLGAYREGLQMPTARCAIVYVHAETAEAKVIELDEDELKQGWDCFKALLAFHQAKTGYKP